MDPAPTVTQFQAQFPTTMATMLDTTNYCNVSTPAVLCSYDCTVHITKLRVNLPERMYTTTATASAVIIPAVILVLGLGL